MIKKFSSVLVLLMILTVVACGGNGAGSKTGVSTVGIDEPVENVELHFYYDKNDNSRQKVSCVDTITELECDGAIKIGDYQKGRLNKLVIGLTKLPDDSNPTSAGYREFVVLDDGSGKFTTTISVARGKHKPLITGYATPVNKNDGDERVFQWSGEVIDTSMSTTIEPRLYLTDYVTVPLSFPTSSLPGNFPNGMYNIKYIQTNCDPAQGMLAEASATAENGIFRLSLSQKLSGCSDYTLSIYDHDANVIKFGLAFNVIDIINGDYVTPQITLPNTSGNTELSLGNISFDHEIGEMLPSNIVDAYVDQYDTLTMVSTKPDALYMMSTDRRCCGIQSIALDFIPTSVSVSPNRMYAVVGHDAHISLINTTNWSKTVFNVPAKVADIVIADNGFIYISSVNENKIFSIDINTGTVSSTWSSSKGEKISLHPSSKFLYSIDTNISPVDIEKFDIQNGVAKLLYDSPYFATYSMCGDILVDTDRIFTSCGTVFSSSEVKSEDLLYSGSLETSNPPYLWSSIDFSLNNIATISNDGKEVKIFNNNLLLKESVTIPSLADGVQQYGKFIFLNGDGTEFYLISSSAEGVFAMRTFKIE